MIKVKNLFVQYDKKIILNDICYDFKDSGFYYIIGQSGAGKTTLLNAICGNIEVTSGSILYEDKNILDFDNCNHRRYMNEIISYIHQESDLIDNITALDNLLMGVTASQEDIEKTLKYLSIYDIANQKVKNLSGGEKQRVQLANAILRNTKIIVADEPTEGLDEENAKKIIDYLSVLSTNVLVIVVTHDKDTAKSKSDFLLEIKDGHLKVIDSPHQNESQKNISLEFKVASKPCDNLTWRQNLILLKSNITKKIGLFIFSMILLTISLVLCFLVQSINCFQEKTVAYEMLRENNSHKDIYDIKRNVSLNILSTHKFKSISKGKNFFEDLSSFKIEKVYLDSPSKTQYIFTDSYSDFSLLSGNLPQNEKEVLISSGAQEKVVNNEITFQNVTYQVCGIVDIICDENNTNFIVSTTRPVVSSSIMGNSPQADDVICRYLSSQDLLFYDYNGQKISGDKEIIVSRTFANYYRLNVGSDFKIKNLYDSKYSEYFFDSPNFFDYVADNVKVVGIVEANDFFIVPAEKVFKEMELDYSRYFDFDKIFLHANLSKDLVNQVFEKGYFIEDHYLSLYSSSMNYIENIEIITQLLFYFSVVLIIIAILIFNNCISSGNKRQLGILKNLGIKKKNIYLQFIFLTLVTTLLIVGVTIISDISLINYLNSILFFIEELPHFSFLTFRLDLFITIVFSVYGGIVVAGILNLIIFHKQSIRNLLN